MSERGASSPRSPSDSTTPWFLSDGYLPVPNSIFSKWMVKLSPRAFTLLLCLYHRTLSGQRARQLAGDAVNATATIDQLRELTGLDREAVQRAAKELVGVGLLSITTGYRRPNQYTLSLRNLVDTAVRVGKADSKNGDNQEIQSGKPTLSAHPLESGKPIQTVPLESEKPTASGKLESGKPTPFKERVLKKETTTTSATAVAADPTIEIQKPENATWIARIGTLIQGPALTPKAVCDAHAELRRHGATWAQAFYVWKHASGGMNQAGGFVRVMREWELYTASVSFPTCFECEDVGSPDEKFPCTCASAEKWLQKHPEAFARADARQKGIRFCEDCKNTGLDETRLPCQCPIGRQLKDDWQQQARAYQEAKKREEQEEQARRDEFQSRGVCSYCEGSKTLGGPTGPGNNPCSLCHGTGLYLTEEQCAEKDICRECRGSGKLAGTVRCYACKGEGKWSSWSDPRSRYQVLGRLKKDVA